MCGRTCLSLNPEQIRCACSYKPNDTDVFLKPDWLPEHNGGKEYVPSYNIAPTDISPVLVPTCKFRVDSPTDRALKPMMWGIIPPWHKGDYRTHNLSTNNCRIENIKSSKLYNPILKNGGRCIILAEGYYEWQTTATSGKDKRPFYLYPPKNHEVKSHSDDDDSKVSDDYFDEQKGWMGVRLLYMAGLYHMWQNNDIIIYSYSVITMDADSSLAWLHHRMPAILDTDEKVHAWLDLDKVVSDMALSYLKTKITLSWHPVSKDVNNSRNKSARCTKEVRKQSSQKTLTGWLTKPNKRTSECDESPTAKRVCNKDKPIRQSCL